MGRRNKSSEKRRRRELIRELLKESPLLIAREAERLKIWSYTNKKA